MRIDLKEKNLSIGGMEETPKPGPGGQHKQLNLNQIATDFMRGLQLHFDVLTFNLAGQATVSESVYQQISHEPGAMPVNPLHQNFEQMQAHALDLMTKQVINDSLNLATACLNNCHLFLAAAKNHKGEGNSSQLDEAASKVLHENQQQFIRKPIDRKFDHMESEYGVMCPLEDSMISLGFCMHALVRQGGIIKDAQLDGERELEIELCEGPGANGPQSSGVADNLTLFTKRFQAGQRVQFTGRELQCILLTVTKFAHELFQSVAKYAKGAQS